MASKDPPRPSARGGRWYARGLRFECLPECASCCTNHDDCTYVYLEGDDARRLASLLGLELADFLERHTVIEDGRRHLRDDGPDCCFLDGRRCSVYPARPTQCRTFPFWPENMATRERWRKLQHFCPGLDRGKLYELPEICERLSAHDLDT